MAPMQPTHLSFASMQTGFAVSPSQAMSKADEAFRTPGRDTENFARHYCPQQQMTHSAVQEWTEDDVEDWLVRFTTVPSSLAAVVREHAITGMVMLTLKEEDLENLNVKFGHRRLLMMAAGELRKAFLLASNAAKVNQHASVLQASFRPVQRQGLQPMGNRPYGNDDVASIASTTQLPQQFRSQSASFAYMPGRSFGQPVSSKSVSVPATYSAPVAINVSGVAFPPRRSIPPDIISNI